MVLTGIFVAYVLSGFLAHPDWSATARGLVVPSIPLTRDAVLIAVATLGTTLAPWGLTFIQSYAVGCGGRDARPDRDGAPQALRERALDALADAAGGAAVMLAFSAVLGV